MATAAWQPGALYIPGSLVRPRTTPPVVQSAPTNADFEAGASGWALPVGYTIGEHGHAFNGTWSLEAGPTAAAGFTNNNLVPVKPGMIIRASAMVNHGNEGSGDAGGAVLIAWFDATMAFISSSDGNQIRKGSTDVWYVSSVVGTAPAEAAFAAIGGFMYTVGDPIWMDQFSWDYTYANSPAGLIFKAVQAQSGYSGSAEPVWPSVVGNTVVDNQVTWEAVLTSRVVYEAHPILKSGTVEPVFPTEIGSTVADGTIIWEATSRQITDERCPHSKYVVTAASKIFAGDKDIIPYSATNNPLDWSTKDDAGFLPFGLQRFGGAPVLGLGLYRSNLVAFNEQGAQMWQVDEDPQNMALLDAVPVGCRYHRSIQPFANDLGFLTDVGIRNFGIAAASTNLQAGDFAKPIDPIVKERLKLGLDPIGLYYPGTGQYMLFMGGEAQVLTLNGTSSRSVSRSRYQLAGEVDDWTVLNGDLYLRSGDKVWRFDEDVVLDDVHTGAQIFQILADAAVLGGVQDVVGFDDLNGFGQIAPDPTSFESGGSTWTVAQFRHYIGGIDSQYELSFSVSPAVPFGTEAPFDRIEFVDDTDTLVVLERDDGVTFHNGAPATIVTVVWPAVRNISDGNAYTVAMYNGAQVGEEFEGYIAWPYLDLQAFGDDVMLHGFDLVGSGEVDVSFGWSQSDESLVTAAYTVQADTLTGQPIAMPIKAPSVQLRLTFAGGQHWKWSAARLYDSPVNT